MTLLKYLALSAMLLLFIMQYACRPVIALVYGVNRNHDFKTTDAYLAYANRKNCLPEKNILFIDSAGYYRTVKYYVNNNKNFGFYLGDYLNDSIKVKESAFLKADEACWGRILKDMDTNVQTRQLQLCSDTFFNNKTLYYAASCKAFRFNSDDKQKIFVFYSTAFGTIFKKHYKKIMDFVQAHPDKAEVYVLSIDYGMSKKDIKY